VNHYHLQPHLHNNINLNLNKLNKLNKLNLNLKENQLESQPQSVFHQYQQKHRPTHRQTSQRRHKAICKNKSGDARCRATRRRELWTMTIWR
jgi:hypothetical protein